LSPISARATMPVETRKACMKGKVPGRFDVLDRAASPAKAEAAQSKVSPSPEHYRLRHGAQAPSLLTQTPLGFEGRLLPNDSAHCSRDRPAHASGALIASTRASPFLSNRDPPELNREAIDSGTLVFGFPPHAIFGVACEARYADCETTNGLDAACLMAADPDERRAWGLHSLVEVTARSASLS